MRRRGITIPGFKYREWEQTRTVYVYATEGVELSNVEKTIDIINDVINEFDLPLQTVNGNATKSEDIPLVENLITSNTEEKSIDCKSILEELRRHWNEDVLRYGLIVLVNPKRYQFKSEPSDPEPACYGWTDYEGFSVLRRFDIQNAVRHEFGHMVGLATIEHHSGCVMDWSCPIQNFCENCVKDINEIWELTSACGAGDSIKPGA
jgi:hypothetical protein